MSGFFKSSYGGKLFLHICKLAWLKSKQIAVQWMEMYVYFYIHKELKGGQTRDFLGKLIHEKKLKLNISCQTPLKGL